MLVVFISLKSCSGRCPAPPPTGWPTMGASSSKRAFFWQKKSPAERAWGRLKGALPVKKRRRKSLLERLRPGNPKNKKFKKGLLLTDKKEPEPFKRFSLGNIKKGAREGGGKEGRKGKEEKTLRIGGAPPRQDVKKTDKPQDKRPKVLWKSKRSSSASV